jgi:hypothetical protein
MPFFRRNFKKEIANPPNDGCKQSSDKPQFHSLSIQYKTAPDRYLSGATTMMRAVWDKIRTLIEKY